MTLRVPPFRRVDLWLIIIVLVGFLALALGGCAERRTEGTSAHRITGTMGGQPVDLRVQGTTSATETTIAPDWFDLLGQVVPAPWGAALTGLGALWFGERRKQKSDNALRQTVVGIDAARDELPSDAVAALETALGKHQDEHAKRLVWEMRP